MGFIQKLLHHQLPAIHLVSRHNSITIRMCTLAMEGHPITHSMDQPGKVANPACGQLNRENEYFPVPVRA